MPRKMADSTDPNGPPDGFDLYAGYLEGAWPSYGGLVARFGAERCISIAVNGDINAVADVYDIERGDYTPAQVPAILAAHPEATIYCNRSDRATISGPVPRWWAATLDGTQQVPGALAVQWIDRGGYDESVVYDDTWHPTEEPMNPAAVVAVLAEQPAGAPPGCWQLTAGGGVFTVAGTFYGSPEGLPADVQAGFVLPFVAFTVRVDNRPGYTCWDSSTDHKGYTFP